MTKEIKPEKFGPRELQIAINNAPALPRSTRRFIAGAAVATAIAILTAGGPAEASRFSDVPDSSPFTTAIESIAEKGIVEGYGNGKFGPQDNLKRAQFTKIIDLALEINASEADTAPFPDVPNSGPESLYPDNFIGAAFREKLIFGLDNGEFGTYEPITRAQATSIIVRTMDKQYPGSVDQAEGFNGDLGNFDPAHGRNMARAQKSGLLDKLDLNPSWDPYKNMSREEIAQLIDNALKRIKESGVENGTKTENPSIQPVEKHFEAKQSTKIGKDEIVVVSADAVINGKINYDDKAETASVSIVIGSADIQFPYPGDVIYVTDVEQANQVVEKIKKQKIDEGIKEVIVTTFK